MDLKGEVSQKIKSAIKAKLVELGQSVDDELPDYIMVMIANKRSKEQMDTDLGLFLGSQTDRFTSWLHQVLNRLKEVTLVTASKGEGEKLPRARKRSSESAEGETSHKKSKRTLEEKKKLKEEKKKKKEDKSSKDIDKKKKRKHREKDKKKGEKPEKEKTDKSKAKLEDVNPEGVKEAKVEELKELEEKLIQQRSDELSSNETKNVSSKSGGEVPAQPPIEPAPDDKLGKTKGDEELSDYESEDDVLEIGLDEKEHVDEAVEFEEKPAPKPTREVIRGPSPVKDQSTRRIIKLKRSPSPTARREVSPPPAKVEKVEKPVKTTATVRPSILSRLGSVVMPVEVKSRTVRRSVSPDVKKPAPRSIPSSIVKVKARPKPVPVNQATKTLIMKAVVDATKSVVSAEKTGKAVPVEEEIKPPERRSVKDRLGHRVVKDEVRRRFEVGDDRVEQKQQQFKDIIKKIRRQLPTEDMETEVVVKLDSEDLTSLPKVLQDDGMEYEIEYEEEEMEEVEETIETIEEEIVSPSPQPKEMWKEPKINERCRNWPWCTYGIECHYVHPSKPCLVFPGCPFGNRCLHIHPKCRFDLGCTKPDCPFTHSGPRTALAALSAVPLVKAAIPAVPAVSTFHSAGLRPASVPACRYFPNCMNPNCPFFHPKICRYGAACTRPDCTYTHPVPPKIHSKPIVSQNQKWVAPNLK